MYSKFLGVSAALAMYLLATQAHALSLREAVAKAVQNNPEIQSVIAARRASDYQLRQAQGALLPRLDLTADFGAQRIDRPQSLSASLNRNWRNRRQASLTVRQILFDGWYRANDIYKNAARVDAVALRVLERSQALGLSAVEAYIDVRRLNHLFRLAKENAKRHEEILNLIRLRKKGGKSPASELDQTLERVAGAKAIVAEIKQSLLEANAKFRRVIGVKPGITSPVGFPKRLPGSRRLAVQRGLAENPSIKAAEAEIDVAKFDRKQSTSAFYPEISLEGSATYGSDISGIPGRDNDLTGRVVMSWNVFNGLITTNRRRELSERWYQAKALRDTQNREVTEAVERAWAAYTVGGTRVAELQRQAELNRRITRTYLEEYRLSKRSLLDLLDSESALFNSRFQLSSVRSVHLFSAYQLLANMGILLDTLGIAAPKEGKAQLRAQTQRSLGVFNINIEPLRKQ